MFEVWIIGWVAGGIASLALHRSGRLIDGDLEHHIKAMIVASVVAFVFCGLPALFRIVNQPSQRIRLIAATLFAVPAPFALLEAALYFM